MADMQHWPWTRYCVSVYQQRNLSHIDLNLSWIPRGRHAKPVAFPQGLSNGNITANASDHQAMPYSDVFKAVSDFQDRPSFNQKIRF